jgi:hypothetical protein
LYSVTRTLQLMPRWQGREVSPDGWLYSALCIFRLFIRVRETSTQVGKATGHLQFNVPDYNLPFSVSWDC